MANIKMKKTNMFYLDSGVYIPGVLIERKLRRPVFVASDPNCGWHKQKIYPDNRRNLVIQPPKSPFEMLIKAENRHFDLIHELIDDDD